MLAAGLLASLLVLTAITLALARYTWSTRLCAPSEQHGVIPRERMRAALRFCAAATVLLGVQTLCRLGRHGVVFTQSNGAFLQFYLRHYGARTEYYLWVGEAGPLMCELCCFAFLFVFFGLRADGVFLFVCLVVFVLFCCPATCPLPLCATVLGGRSIDDGTAVGLPVWRQYSMQRRFLAAAAAAHESRAGHVSRQQYPAVPVEAAAAAAVAAPPRVSVDTHKIAVDGEMYRCVHCAAKSPL
ncbi:hypothetical protein EJ05DRAFT_478425 [Pseudovirgaria hyperparasitica]|uniref:Uncharacterized protein n=1 Tax=Pseudovirgaria hyperparasitica TaxID=470096 RepID=A0A6A6W0F2_9PEZI|nr:uncharacterized protein EJ05DRAFT_478425 [Pseudovirgaria hyperparasitica]KAF2755410.1 hypothetical protein EJ05DRAFT_478425 [Pseudovirgaria hyperparasitica]